MPTNLSKLTIFADVAVASAGQPVDPTLGLLDVDNMDSQTKAVAVIIRNAVRAVERQSRLKALRSLQQCGQDLLRSDGPNEHLAGKAIIWAVNNQLPATSELRPRS